MTPTIEELARGLTEAQKRAVMEAESDGHLGNRFVRWWQADRRTIKSLRSRSLGTAVWSGMMLTPLGITLRAYLEKTHG
ncbi:hypothetical protein OSJ57_00080 [Sphingomonas sp. HH69]